MTSDDLRPVFLAVAPSSSQKSTSESIYVDAFPRQIRELYLIDNPHLRDENKSALFESADFLKYAANRENSCVYVHYPWNNHAVRTVSAEDYFRLKTNRNQDLITAEEQTRLYNYRIAVFGLSVGSNIAHTLTQAGISREITLADFDALDTTNLNRIFGGVHQIGLNKSVVAARRIYEDNPFASVEVMTDGVNPDSLEQLLRDRRVDCIVEEVDDLRFKIEARVLAMKYRVPIVMVTDNGDGIILHVERYDLGYAKIFGKEKSFFDALPAAMTKEMLGAFIMETIVGGMEFVDTAMLASVKRVLNKELVSWSQLGSAALLGGVVATFMVRQIALNKNSDPDIRAYISPTMCKWGTHEN